MAAQGHGRKIANAPKYGISKRTDGRMGIVVGGSDVLKERINSLSCIIELSGRAARAEYRVAPANRLVSAQRGRSFSDRSGCLVCGYEE